MTRQCDYFCGLSILRGILFLEGLVTVKICLLFHSEKHKWKSIHFHFFWKGDMKSGKRTKTISVWRIEWDDYLSILYKVLFFSTGFLGIYLTKKTSINIRDPKLPEVGQLTNHHIWQLLHKLHLLWGFKVPGWKQRYTHITITHWRCIFI